MARGDLTDDEWALVEPFLPLGVRGPVPPLRQYFNGVMWRFRVGSPWRDLPERFGPWSTVYGRFELWTTQGVFTALFEAMIAEAAARGQVDLSLVSIDSTVARAHHHAAGMRVDPELLDELAKAVEEEKGGDQQVDHEAGEVGEDAREDAERSRQRRRRKLRLRKAELGRSRGGLTCKTHLAADRRCRPLAFVITPGQDADSPRFQQVLGKVRVRGKRGRPRTRPDAVAGDKAYSSRANRTHLRKRGIKAVIPEKTDQTAHRRKRGSTGGRPISHDAELYKDRNSVERCINRIKEWRGLAARYDKTPTAYLAGLELRGAVIWLRSLRPA